MGWGTPKIDRFGAAQRCFASRVEFRRVWVHHDGAWSKEPSVTWNEDTF
jgi:hypothetical protein